MSGNKKFGLVWEYKEEDVVQECKSKLPVISSVPDLDINKGAELNNNIMIEGDNYHALSVLNYTHKEKIDVIYIDPPYNTGAKDWRYNNNYIDKQDSFRHSKWLNMMNSRLRLAKNLLSKKGFICIAIDHYELFNLGLLCDQIFGEENRCGLITIVHKPEGRQTTNYFNPVNEYILVYRKGSSQFNKTAIDEELKKRFDRHDEIGTFMLKPYLNNDMMSRVSRTRKPKFWYPIYVSKDLKEVTLTKKDGYKEVLPITPSGNEKTWQTVASTTIERINNKKILAENDRNGEVRIYYKFREQQRFKTTWTDKKYNATANGTNILSKIIGKGKFDYPKSIYAVLDFLKITSKKDSTILDFFAGSGTTGHATLMLNKEDGGNRKFILCTNNENNIARGVCHKRIKTVIEGKKGLDDITGFPSNLKYYKCEFKERGTDER